MKFLKKIIEIPQKIVNGILLSVVYFFGISLTYLISKFTNKTLFDFKKKTKDKQSLSGHRNPKGIFSKSYWKPYVKDDEHYRMY